MRDARQDADLAEVKAVLKKLQRLDVSEETPLLPIEFPLTQSRSDPPAAAASQSLGVFERKHAAFSARPAPPNRSQRARAYLASALSSFSALRAAPGLSRARAHASSALSSFSAVRVGPRSSRRMLIYAASASMFIVGGGGVILAVVMAPDNSTRIERGADSKPAPDRKSEGVALTEARRLLAEGNVAAARKQLLDGGPEVRAELAFLLAQSFDPNYLRTLPASNSLPDRIEAERWYKKWYELAVNSGLAMDSGRLQRIIKAMH
jgi:hypothetical protein